MSSKKSSNPTPAADQDWEAVRAIPNDALKKLVSHHLGLEAELDAEGKVSINERVEGSFHHCAILTVRDHGDFVIRIPAIGTATLWKGGHAYNLRSEVETMKMLFNKTNLPSLRVPEIITSSDTIDNQIGAPFILMRALPGKKAYHVWFEEGDPDTGFCDFPSPERQKLRETFLFSLADVMADLSTIRLDKIGMLTSDGDASKLNVGHSYFGNSDHTLSELPAFASSREFWTHSLSHQWHFEDNKFYRGMHILLSLVAKAMPTDTDEEGKESFVLTHMDVDLHNIFTDDEGYITGLIDWDLTKVLPQCVGPASYPVFLREDWSCHYKLEDARHMPFALEPYRKFYAQQTDKMIGKEYGSKHTAKSALYHAAAEALTRPMHYAHSFAERLFREHEVLRGFDVREFLETMSEQGEEGRGATLIRNVLERIF